MRLHQVVGAAQLSRPPLHRLPFVRYDSAPTKTMRHSVLDHVALPGRESPDFRVYHVCHQQVHHVHHPVFWQLDFQNDQMIIQAGNTPNHSGFGYCGKQRPDLKGVGAGDSYAHHHQVCVARVRQDHGVDVVIDKRFATSGVGHDFHFYGFEENMD
jgi:hypothetical protein